MERLGVVGVTHSGGVREARVPGVRRTATVRRRVRAAHCPIACVGRAGGIVVAVDNRVDAPRLRIRSGVPRVAHRRRAQAAVIGADTVVSGLRALAASLVAFRDRAARVVRIGAQPGFACDADSADALGRRAERIEASAVRVSAAFQARVSDAEGLGHVTARMRTPATVIRADLAIAIGADWRSVGAPQVREALWHGVGAVHAAPRDADVQTALAPGVRDGSIVVALHAVAPWVADLSAGARALTFAFTLSLSAGVGVAIAVCIGVAVPVGVGIRNAAGVRIAIGFAPEAELFERAGGGRAEGD